MTVWFTSDLHLGHRKVAELRGFDSVISHDLAIAEAWMAVVQPDDQVWVLGDLTSGSNGQLAPALTLLDALPGEKHLIAGNHDQVHPMNRDSHKWQRRFLGTFDSVQPFARRKVAGRSVLLSHFPYERDRDEPRYTQYRLRNEGLWLLHGHTHGTEQLTTGFTHKVTGVDLDAYAFQHTYMPTREVHVGWDAWGELVHLDQVAALIEEAEA